MKIVAKKQKYYVVWKGKCPGIYDSWSECQVQIKGFSDARYKSFESQEEARQAFQGQAEQFLSKKSTTGKKAQIPRSQIIKNSISVDAACSGNPGTMEYQGVSTDSGKTIFHQGPFTRGTNNIGEFLAIVHALALLKKAGRDTTVIYTDSRTAMSWVKNKKAKTQLERTLENSVLFDLIQRAESWLHTHTYNNPIIKWETESWGEIPADFGRK